MTVLTRTRATLIAATSALIVLAGCGTADVDETPDEQPLAQPDTTTEPAPTTTAPQESDRGLLRKDLGEIAGITTEDGADAVRFAIEAITVDPDCTAEFAEPPEHGHYIAVRMNIETTAAYEADIFFAPNAHEFSIEGPDGFTDAAVGTGPALGCLPESEQLPWELGPAGKFAGAVVLDTKYDSGILMFKPPIFNEIGTGWEWEIPTP